MTKILLVDDEEVVLMLYAEELKEEGFEVVTVDNGYGLIERIASVKPDLVVLDIKLGEHNGLDLLQAIKKRYYDLPVIICSAYSSFKGDLKSIGADYYIVKDSDLTELTKKIRICVRCQNKKEDVSSDNIKDLVRKKVGLITKHDRASLYLQAKDVACTMDKSDIDAILDHEIEMHNQFQTMKASYSNKLRKAYRAMILDGYVSLKNIPNMRTVHDVFEKHDDLWTNSWLVNERNALVQILRDEHHEFLIETKALQVELLTALNALKKCDLDQIRNYENLKRVLTSREEDYSPLLLGEDFGIILDDFHHDMKNAVRAINDLVEDAVESIGGASRTKLTELLSTIKQRIRAAAQLVKEMEQVPFVRSVIPEPVNLKARIEEIIIDLKISSHIKWEVLTDPSELLLTTDTRLFSIILKNVIKNAVEAMPQGGHLKVTALEATKLGKIDIDISDTGVGIPADFIPKVFDLKFSRGKEKGRGMGLYIARKATVAMGGIIFIDSVENQGTTVHIKLPKGG